MTPLEYIVTFNLGAVMGCEVYGRVEMRVDMQTLSRWLHPTTRIGLR
jgi:hypothetical protein